jgi:hypothetical protein
MTRRSTLKRRRDRKKHKHYLRKKAVQQLVPSRPSTAELLELAAHGSSPLAQAIREQQN